MGPGLAPTPAPWSPHTGSAPTSATFFWPRLCPWGLWAAAAGAGRWGRGEGLCLSEPRTVLSAASVHQGCGAGLGWAAQALRAVACSCGSEGTARQENLNQWAWTSRGPGELKASFPALPSHLLRVHLRFSWEPRGSQRRQKVPESSDSHQHRPLPPPPPPTDERTSDGYHPGSACLGQAPPVGRVLLMLYTVKFLA